MYTEKISQLATYLQVQQEGKRNQSMKMPEQSLLGSKDSRRCHLYFCSQEQSRLHRRVEGALGVDMIVIGLFEVYSYVQISW